MKYPIFRRQWPLAITIITIAAAATYYLVQPKPQEEHKAEPEAIQQVPVTVLEPREINMPINTQGIVEPRTKVKLVAEVNGKVLSVSGKWNNGGFFRKGEEVLRVEDYYYQNQLARAKAALAQAKAGLVQEEGFSYVARQEWEKRNAAEDNSAAKSLALREPQLAAIKSQVEAASADVVAAEHALEQTRIVAPFDGVLVNKLVDAGQFISPGVSVGDLLAIDVVEVRVPLTEAQQAFLDLPALNQTTRIPAIIRYDSPEGSETWHGQLVRTEGVLDPVSRVLNGVVQIQDPYGLNKPAKSPLRLGTFVEIELAGRKMKNIFVIPRRFLYTGNKVWLVDAENKLRVRDVKVLPIRENDVYIYEGLAAGEKMVAGGVVGMLDGKVVKPVPAEQPKSPGSGT